MQCALVTADSYQYFSVFRESHTVHLLLAGLQTTHGISQYFVNLTTKRAVAAALLTVKDPSHRRQWELFNQDPIFARTENLIEFLAFIPHRLMNESVKNTILLFLMV